MIKISKTTSNAVIDYAAEELKKYLDIMSEGRENIEIVSDEGGFRLGLMKDFGLNTDDAKDPILDDIIYIDTKCDGGIIAGNNPRSVLLAVYEYLRQNGCRWLFPGKEGEYIPKVTLSPIKYRYKPTFRYRGPCMEGAVNQKIILDTIEFIPKVGMNLFMSQFVIPTVFYHRYHSHGYNNYLTPGKVERETVAKWKVEFEHEVEKRGLQFLDMGHGFCVLPFGVTGADTWRPAEGEVHLPEENRKYMAMINGVRGLRDERPLITNFCMSNPEARRKVVSYIADFAEEHLNVTTLHVCLSDSYNGHCECDECAKKTPSDWYMVLMNEIDEELSKRNLATKILFVVYNDTCFAPLTEKIEEARSDRFALMMAPIRRKYSKTSSREDVEVPTYVRNDITLPESLDEYLAHIKNWRKNWHGSTFAFEYHFWRFQCLDVSGLDIAERIHEDIECYEKLGFDGIIACGSQRSYFPTGFAYYTFARKLFDSQLSLEEIKKDYFSHAFGKYAEKCFEYLNKIQNAFSYKYMSGEESADVSISLYYNPSRTEKLKAVSVITEEMREFIKGVDVPENSLIKQSFELLLHHTDYADMVAGFILPLTLGDKKTAREKYDILKTEMSKREPVLERYYDHWLNIAYIERPIRTDDKFW